MNCFKSEQRAQAILPIPDDLDGSLANTVVGLEQAQHSIRSGLRRGDQREIKLFHFEPFLNRNELDQPKYVMS